MLAIIKGIFDPGKKIINQAKKRLPEIEEAVREYEGRSTEELQRIFANFRAELAEISTKITDSERESTKLRKRSEGISDAEKELYDKIQELMPSVYAIIALATKRKQGIFHYDEQFLAGIVLATGQKLVEMKTGEGKTNTFHLPLGLFGLTGRGAHLVTVNDYLAKRDGEYAGHIFSDLGLTVGVINPGVSYKFIPDSQLAELKGEAAVAEREEIGDDIRVSKLKGSNLIECSKRDAYACDIVVGTNNEFGFDYLRDNMIYREEERSQRELFFCIVDEADSILIDEARTPLIISAPAAKSNERYHEFAAVAKKLKPDIDYTVEEKERATLLTDEGSAKVEKLLGVKNIWADYSLAHHLENALKAKEFYRRDKEYLLRDGEVVIVDEFTGRALAGRRYSEGLHQAIEAKEGVEIQRESRTLATITFQNFFRIYKILTGGSGTIMTEQEEFFKIYNLESAAIPTHKPVVRIDETDRVYKTREAKFEAVATEITEATKEGQPILVGTTSIGDSEYLSKLLKKKKVQHEVLNAKFHEREAQVVAKAGQVGSVTVATNMAGRGTDIPLGDGAIERGGLYVIGTERHESRRIDNQLRGRSGRQGDPGKSRFFVALDDQIMRIQGGEMVQRIMNFANLPDDLPIESGMISNSIERAQKKMEGMYFDSRKRVVEYDDVVNQQREIFYTRRLRYVKLIGKFIRANELQDQTEREESKEALQKDLFDEFREEIEAVARETATTVSENKSASKKQAELLIGLGIDKYFIFAANKLKLYREEIADNEKLIEVLSSQLEKLAESPEKIEEFVESFLRTTVEEKIADIENHAGLIAAIFLRLMDELWTFHLDHMQDLREGIGLRGMAQLDPLVEYKNEGFTAFSNLVARINREALQSLLQVTETKMSVPNRPQPKQVTNSEQISDLLTGDREIAGRQGSTTSPRTSATRSSSARAGEQKLTRRQRRKLERSGKSKK